MASATGSTHCTTIVTDRVHPSPSRPAKNSPFSRSVLVAHTSVYSEVFYCGCRRPRSLARDQDQDASTARDPSYTSMFAHVRLADRYRSPGTFLLRALSIDRLLTESHGASDGSCS